MIRGFTLLEILIVVFIVGIIGAIVISGFTSFQERQILELATKDVRQLIERARSQTIASIDDQAYGVFIANDYVVLFSGNSYDADSSDNVVHTLHPKTHISYIELTPETDEIVFSRRTGEPSSFGSVEISLVTNPQVKRDIFLSQTGMLSSNE